MKKFRGIDTDKRAEYNNILKRISLTRVHDYSNLLKRQNLKVNWQVVPKFKNTILSLIKKFVDVEIANFIAELCVMTVILN